MAAPQFNVSQILWLAALVAGGRGNVDIATAVCLAESSGRPDAYNVNTDAQHSVDRGLWQLNNYWHAEVSDDCAYRALCNARNAFRISNGWSDFTPWSTYNGGQYLLHMPGPLIPETPIPGPTLSRLWKPSNAPSSGLVAGANPFTGTVGIVTPAPAPSQDHSQKTIHTGARASVHGNQLNDAANAIHRLPVGRSRY